MTGGITGGWFERVMGQPKFQELVSRLASRPGQQPSQQPAGQQPPGSPPGQPPGQQVGQQAMPPGRRIGQQIMPPGQRVGQTERQPQVPWNAQSGRTSPEQMMPRLGQVVSGRGAPTQVDAMAEYRKPFQGNRGAGAPPSARAFGYTLGEAIGPRRSRVRMRDSVGAEEDVPSERVAEFESLGARRV